MRGYTLSYREKAFFWVERNEKRFEKAKSAVWWKSLVCQADSIFKLDFALLGVFIYLRWAWVSVVVTLSSPTLSCSPIKSELTFSPFFTASRIKHHEWKTASKRDRIARKHSQSFSLLGRKKHYSQDFYQNDWWKIDTADWQVINERWEYNLVLCLWKEKFKYFGCLNMWNRNVREEILR